MDEREHVNGLGNGRIGEDAAKGLLTLPNVSSFICVFTSPFTVQVITKNPRYSVTFWDGGRLSRLTISNVRPTDEGWYICSINSQPETRLKGFIQVTGKYRYNDV